MRASHPMRKTLSMTFAPFALVGTMALTACGQQFSAANLGAQTTAGPGDLMQYPSLPSSKNRVQENAATVPASAETTGTSPEAQDEITELIEKIEKEQHTVTGSKTDLEKPEATASAPQPTPKPKPTPVVRPKVRPEIMVSAKNDEAAEPEEKPEKKSEEKTVTSSVRPKPRPTKESTGSSLPVQVRGFWEEAHSSGRQWTQITSEALEEHGKDLMNAEPSDAKYYCAKFKTLERDARMSFWVHLLSAIAIRESRLRPHVKYEEKFNDSSGENVVSRGLLQISLESSRYYDCGIKSSKDLHDPEKNLICGVKILNQWIPKDKVLQGKRGRTYLGAGRYWSVMRKGESQKWIKSQMNKLDFCQ